MVTNSTTKMWSVCLASLFLLAVSQSATAQGRPKYRTLDGTLNNLSYPQFGNTNIPFFRELPAEYADGKNALANRPNPRLISNKLSDEPEDKHNDRYMSGMFYIWGQYLDHDMTKAKGGTEAMPIPLPSGESKFSNPISFKRSAVHSGSGVTTPRDQTNLTTSWIDASQLYGNNPTTAAWLRTFQGGKLKSSAGDFLPFNTLTGEYDSPIDPNAPNMDDDYGKTTKTFVAGDSRANEHPVLASLHTLFKREHNRICDGMKNSGLSDEEIYQKARKEVGALFQAITYGQWISSLGVTLSPYTGYKPNARPDVMNSFATAAYRWHTMVENDIIFRDNECRGVGPSELPLKEIFNNPSIIRKNGIGVLLKGISVHRQYETDLQVNSGLRNNLLGPGMNLDLVSINLQRGRDHGLPNYNVVRNFYTGSKAYSFSDIAGSSRTSVSSSSPASSSSLVSDVMQSLYGNVNDVDLWVGLYAEPRMPGKSVGKTVDAIFRAQLERLRDGDFYYYENDPELSAADKIRIKNTKLGDIIARNTDANNLQDNVFFVKSCASTPTEFDDIAKWSCNVTPQYEGWTFLGKTGSKSYYKWNGGNANFVEAKLLASRLGGTLPQIANATENNMVKSFIPAGTSAWMNLNRNGVLWQYTGIFDQNDVLIAGKFSPYFNWRAGEPNNVGGIENRVQMTADGQWNDIPEATLQAVIAEVPCISDCVNDITPPTFTSCPPNQSVGMGILSICKPAYWAHPTATDNCGFASVVQTGGFTSGWCLLPGTHNVTYTATDLKGNKSYCNFSVSAYKTGNLFLKASETIAIDAIVEPNKVLIDWVTNTGSKNDYYTVEKLSKTTGQFEPLAVVNNLNKDDAPTHYNAYDETPEIGDNTYHVKVTYQDGTTKLSDAKTVNFKGLSDIVIYPNPANDILSVDLSAYKNQAVEMVLYNYLGQQQLVTKIDKVENTIVELDVAGQQVGQYMIRVKAKGRKDVVKSVVIAH